MNPSSPASSGQPPPGSHRRLQEQLRRELAALLQRSEAEAGTERRAAAQLTERIENKMRRDRSRYEEVLKHTYGVFAVGGRGRRRMVLRDVADLDGRPPLCTTDDFAEALRYAGESLEDPVRRPRPPVDIAELKRTLRQLVKELQAIESGNQRIAGSGTTADPFARTDDHALPVRAPINVGIAGVQPDQLQLHAHGPHLLITPKPSAS